MATPKDSRGRPLTYGHLKSKKKAPVRRVVIPLDDEMAAAWQDADGRYQLSKVRLEVGIENKQVREQVVNEMAEAQAKLDELREEMEDNVAVFKIKGLGQKKFQRMQEQPEYQPTDEHLKVARRNNPNAQLDWNPDTFPPAIMAACCIEPELTLEEAQEMWESDEWTEGELLTILNACLGVNTEVRNLNWGKG